MIGTDERRLAPRIRSHPSATPPTRARHIVTVFAVTLSVITYIDRVCISQAAPAIRSRSRAVGHPDGVGVHRLRLGLRPVRSAGRLAGGSYRPPSSVDADRGVVVVLHRRDRVDLEPAVAARDPLPVRRWRGGLFPEPYPRLHHLAPGPRARARAGHPLAQLQVGCRPDAAPRRLPAAIHLVAPGVRVLRRDRGRLGRRVLHLVPRRAERPPRRQPSELAMLPPSRDTAVVRGPIPWRKLLASPTIWLLCAQYICLATGGGSTSPGCPRT